MNLLKASEAKDNKTEQLKAIRKLLVYFRDYDNMQKDKILTLLDNMIENKDCSDIMPLSKIETKSVTSAMSMIDKINPAKDAEPKPAKASLGNKSSRVKNTLFGIHKEEANNITKLIKPAEAEASPKPKKAESFQSPQMNSNFDKADKKMMSGFTRMPTSLQPGQNS
mmetsp:Transcript_1269/g.1337  ORF Transcript_1269/g.1337 Transcript_1269/m.1337 type:complete len:167 (+) Transcript_1269:819-1319(+)